MKKLSLLLFILSGLWACNHSPQESNNAQQTTSTVTENTLTEAERVAGWTLLFDGQSTNQWRGYLKETFPKEGWTVKNGKLIITRGGGDLITKKKYGNFELSLEYKIHGEGGNSGIFYTIQEIECILW